MTLAHEAFLSDPLFNPNLPRSHWSSWECPEEESEPHTPFRVLSIRLGRPLVERTDPGLGGRNVGC